MVFSLLYLVLAAFGLGFLIFIHELGHYWIARREGMTVEAFSIGFGKPIYMWERKGVKWQFCWLPFGGYVRIAGMEKKGRLEPYEIPDGFYGKKPLSRIKVALMGPIVNIVFALLAFSIIWFAGGRIKSFSEYTHLIGRVDAGSGLYISGVRPGDEIAQVNGESFKGFSDLLYAAILDDSELNIHGSHINYLTQQKDFFSYTFPFLANEPGAMRAQILAQTLSPANYLIYRGAYIPPNAPIYNSGIVSGDRIVWADGACIFSKDQLIQTINEPRALITIKRGADTFIARVPRILISDLRLNVQQKSELDDWQHAGDVSGKLSDLYFIPYNLTVGAVVEEPIIYLNEQSNPQVPGSEEDLRNAEIQLEPGDQILAVDGNQIQFAYELLKEIQTRHIQIIVHHEKDSQPILWTQADKDFISNIDWMALSQMIGSIGTDQSIVESGSLKRLQPITPIPQEKFIASDLDRARYAQQYQAQKNEIENISDSKERQQKMIALEQLYGKLKLGITLEDRKVAYNPNPLVQFAGVFQEVYRTMFALMTGYVSPKNMAGPIGIVQVMQYSWGHSFKEALFWMGMISLNLGLLNLLPIPVLDGGHVCFSIWEMITKKPIKAKTMERLILPFVVLLIAFFIYVTYHDLVRLVGRFF